MEEKDYGHHSEWQNTEEEPLPEETLSPPESPRPRWRALKIVWNVVIALLLLISLGLNFYILDALQQARDNAVAVLASARTGLEEFTSEPMVTVVEIDQTIPISETFPFSHTFSVPVDFVYPFSARVNTTINIPLLGPQRIAIPIDASVPVNMDFEVPINTAVPISMTYDVQMSVPVEFTLPPELLAPVDEILQEAEEALR